MSAFAGIVALTGSAIDQGAENRAASALIAWRKGRTIARRIENAIFVHRASPQGTNGEEQPLTSPNGHALFAADARLDNRGELGQALGLAPFELAHTTDAALIHRVYERWGDGGVARCLGAFAFAHWDAAARRLTLGRDCLGNRPLFYHCGPQFVSFATNLGTLLALPGVPRAVDESALAQFIAINIRDDWQTFYRDIERVPSRTLVTIGHAGVRRRHYWSPNLDAPQPYRRDEDYVERARELLDIAVASATRGTPRVAITTSGGLDSSAIAATAARQGLSESVACFCMAAPVGADIDVGAFKYLDERDKVEALARMYPSLDVRPFHRARSFASQGQGRYVLFCAGEPAFACAGELWRRPVSARSRSRGRPSSAADWKLREFWADLGRQTFAGRAPSSAPMAQLSLIRVARCRTAKAVAAWRGLFAGGRHHADRARRGCAGSSIGCAASTPTASPITAR